MMAADEQGVPGNAAGERKQRVGVFVDVENVLGWLKRGGCTELLAKASELGVVGIRRAFGDFSNATVASRQDELQRHGFDLVHTVHPAKGKSNSADISMTIDVMESCRGPDIQWVMLATGDSDFGPVFRRLRELGKGVVGVGPSSVLSSSVALSCHEFIFTDDSSSRSGSAKKGRGKGGKGERSTNTGATATWADMGGRGGGTHRAAARVATPPQLLCARGGFRFKPQPVVGEGSGGGRAAAGAVSAGGESAASHGDRGVPTSPLLIDGPAPTAAPASATKSFGPGKGPVIDWTTLPSTPPPQKPSPQVDLSTAFARVALEGEAPAPAPAVTEPLLSPGQLLVPEMVTATAAATAVASSSSTVSPPPPRLRGPHADVGATSTGTAFRTRCPPPRTAGGVLDGSGSAAGNVGGGAAAYGGQAHWAQNTHFHSSSSGSGNGGVRGHGSRGAGTSTPPPPPPSLPPAFGGLGALSVIRPSEKLYRHLLSVECSPSAAADRTGDSAGSLASDWGSGLSEVTVAKGLVSLAEACGGQDGGEHPRAAAAAAAAAAVLGGIPGDSKHGGDGVAGEGVALDREEAFRVANLLQRCGFLSWVAKEQQWLVTVPADVEVLRRRRDETMMEELLTRCQEAGVPFEPTLAANLLWSKARR